MSPPPPHKDSRKDVKKDAAQRASEPSAGLPQGAGEEEQAGGAEEALEAAPAGRNADPDLVLLHADKPVPSLAELRSAMDWAFAGEEIEPAALDDLARFALLVLEGNRRMNLTAILDPREVAAKHMLDSYRATRLVPLAGRRVLDVGSGAGFPGIPIAIAERDTKVTLVDSMQKRAAFLRECVEKLGLKNVNVAAERGEDHLQRARYDMVVMRSLSSVRENVRLLRKVKHSFKDLVMLKGPAWSREARAAEREAERLGFRLDTVWEHQLPGDMGARAILVYRAPGSHEL